MEKRAGQAADVLTHTSMQFIVLIIQFIVSVAFNLMGSFLPLFISSELNYTLIEATQWTGLCQLVASSLYALTAPFWGFMCDRAGTKKIMMIAIVGNTVAYAGMTFSGDITHIILFRGLQGAFGGISTVMFTIVALITPSGKLKMALSYQMTAMTMASLVGPGIGGLLVSVFGYRLTLATSAVLFVSLTPLIFMVKMPSSASEKDERSHFQVSDLKVIMPDIISLILVYACTSFIMPVIPWFLKSLGIPSEQLITFTAITTILNGLAFGIASPTLTKVITDRTLPILSTASAVAIFMTIFATDPYQFIALRLLISAIQSGIPPNLLGGKSGRKGTAMGILNSARFTGMAIGPYMATSILGDGTAPRPFYMFTVMAGISLFAAVFLYLTHIRRSSIQTRTE